MKKMKKLLSASLVAASVAAAPSVSMAAPPACVTKLISNVNAAKWEPYCPNGLAPMKLVIHRKNNTWVSYSQGSFTFDASGHPFTGDIKQAFSDRFVSGSSQNFNINGRDTHTVRVNKDTGAITIVNKTWNFTTTVQGTCNGNTIVASDAAHMYLITSQPGVCLI